MHYVKQFNINGVDTKQVACIELQGKPNAATEGALGVLGIDMTSPLHDVYKCVAVNGSIYTWELLSSGTCVMSSIITGAGEELVEFPYNKLKTVANYIVKVGDVIIDKEGYLYQVESLKNTSCMAGYNGTQIVSGMPKVGEVDNGKILSVVDGCHAFVNVEESSVGQYVDESVTELAEEVDNTYAKTADLKNGTITVNKATSATYATRDASGTLITSYAKKSELTSGAIEVAKATSATQDGSGNDIENTYAKKVDLENGTLPVSATKLTALYQHTISFTLPVYNLIGDTSSYGSITYFTTITSPDDTIDGETIAKTIVLESGERHISGYLQKGTDEAFPIQGYSKMNYSSGYYSFKYLRNGSWLTGEYIRVPEIVSRVKTTKIY